MAGKGRGWRQVQRVGRREETPVFLEPPRASVTGAPRCHEDWLDSGAPFERVGRVDTVDGSGGSENWIWQEVSGQEGAIEPMALPAWYSARPSRYSACPKSRMGRRSSWHRCESSDRDHREIRKMTRSSNRADGAFAARDGTHGVLRKLFDCNKKRHSSWTPGLKRIWFFFKTGILFL